jgi:TM2 domain-containing membrane protein YozV|tara:strand:+ start:307 stop:693 length:387 start_codon:yes stop_codon:yes gene_type:complete
LVAKLNAEEVDNKEESIRLRVSFLDDDKRKQYYLRMDNEFKDPDTYAVLNLIFLAGLHHFYLKRYIRGSVNLLVFTIGGVLLFSDTPIVGVVTIGLILLFELYELFFSQLLTQQYNNRMSEEILLDLE